MDEFNRVDASIKRSNDSFNVSQMEPVPAPGSLGALLDSTTDLLGKNPGRQRIGSNKKAGLEPRS